MTTLTLGSEAPLALRILADTALVLHIGGGTVGILAGATAMIARKGERLHRLAGHVFFGAMLTMTSIAAVVAPMLPDAKWTNTTAAVFTLYLVISGWLTARRRPGAIGLGERTAVIIPLGIAAMGVGLLWYGPASGRASGFITVYIFALISALAAVCDIMMIRQGGVTGRARTARHLWRMSVACFVATGSFFLGQQKVMPVEMRGNPLLFIPALAPLVGLAFFMIRVRLPRLTQRPAAA